MTKKFCHMNIYKFFVLIIAACAILFTLPIVMSKPIFLQSTANHANLSNTETANIIGSEVSKRAMLNFNRLSHLDKGFTIHIG